MTDNKQDEKRFNETLKRLLKTPPKPHKEGKKDSLTESHEKRKPGGNPAKNDHPET